MNTKEKIIIQALHLFNSEGVEKITTRHIAKSLEISQGNLHYHYPNKDEIIIFLFQQFLEEIKNAAIYDPKEYFLKENVLLSMKENFKIMYAYRFLFKDNELVWRRLPKVKKAVIKLFRKKKIEILEIIEQYKKQKIFRPEISNEQIDYLAEQFIFSISTWLIASEYMLLKGNKADYFAQFTFRLWLPYLKEKEMKNWEAIL